MSKKNLQWLPFVLIGRSKYVYMAYKNYHQLASVSSPLPQSIAVPHPIWKTLLPDHDMVGPFSNVISERPSPTLPSPSLPVSYDITLFIRFMAFIHIHNVLFIS